MKLFLNYERYTYSTREPYTDDTWDRGDTHTDYSFGEVSFDRNDREFESFEVSEGYKKGDKIYIVVVVYSTGDSFGSDSCGCLDVVSSHRNLEDALVSSELVKDHEGGPLLLPDNYDLSYAPWLGYFESLEYVEVLERIIE